MAEKIIKMASFPYTGEDGVERTALRGDTVDIPGDADLARGERLGVFASKDDLKPGTVFGDFYTARKANVAAAAAAGLPVLVETATDPEPTEKPPGAPAPEVDPPVRPGGADSREKWAAYATAKGAPESETGEGGLSRDELRAKYGS